MAYVKVASSFLAQVGPLEAEARLRALLGDFGPISSALVSRIDPFVDFASSVDMESWDRHAWVTRVRSINGYSVDGKFTGWSIGQGGSLSSRLYHKLLEIETSGKRYLLALWEEAGWDRSLPVWRQEFQFQREVLTERGLSFLPEVLGNLNGLQARWWQTSF